MPGILNPMGFLPKIPSQSHLWIGWSDEVSCTQIIQLFLQKKEEIKLLSPRNRSECYQERFELSKKILIWNCPKNWSSLGKIIVYWKEYQTLFNFSWFHDTSFGNLGFLYSRDFCIQSDRPKPCERWELSHMIWLISYVLKNNCLSRMW